MNPFYLSGLLKRYRPHASDSIDPVGDLVTRYRQYKQTLPIDLAAVATGLALSQSKDLDPLALQAIQDTNPNFDPERLGDYTAEQWLGIVNTAKGKYYEYLVVDRLNSGETVGMVTLPSGYRAELADSMIQEGWDVRIIDDNGQVAEFLQLKATDSIGYIYATLERYPDIQILTTNEVADQLTDHQMVLNSDISEQRLQQTIESTLDTMDRGFLTEFWETFNPLVPLLVIAATQGYQIAVNKQDVAAAVEIAKERAARSIVAGGAGALTKIVTDSFLLALPVTLGIGWLFDRAHNIDHLIDVMRQSNETLKHRSFYYQQLIYRGV